ncbi:MAG: hypothetical protein KGP28_12710 [Bdellovibrionales bacterium]|nr:hypothetical protein [Bdellovibrionales bacterium]
MARIAKMALALGCMELLLGIGHAYAIDQVILNDGRVVEGTVLNDVPNRHVDIRLSNGRTERYSKNDVAAVERDVPSGKDGSMKGSESKGWVSLLLGGHINASQGMNNGMMMDLMFGAKVGINAAHLDFARLAFALSYDYVSAPANAGFISINRDFHDINVQALLTRLGGSGFYAGPNVGLAMFSANSGFGGGGFSNMTSHFEFGFGAGYEFFVSPGFAIGPDFRYEDIATIQRSAFKFALQGSFQF